MTVRSILTTCLVALTVSTVAVVPATADQTGKEQWINPAPAVAPSLREWRGGHGQWFLTGASRIVLDGRNAVVLTDVAEQLRDDLKTMTGQRLPVLTGARARTGDLVLSATGQERTAEGYRLDIGGELRIDGDGPVGALYGSQVILQMLKLDPLRRAVPKGTARDWPEFGERGQMIDVGRKFHPVDYLKSQIRRMAWLRLNTLHLHLSDWNGFRMRSDRYPGLASPEAYSKAELRDLQDYARRFGVTIIPELDLPAHATHISRFDPQLAFGCRSMSYSDWPGGRDGGWTLDITKPRTRQFIHDILDELMDVFDGKQVHFGGDEWQYDDAKRACPELMAYAAAHGYPEPGDVFVEFMNEVNAKIAARGRTGRVWQWWDFNGQRTTIKPSKDLVVDVWLGGPESKAAEGYRVSGNEDGKLYVTPGAGTAPGQYGYMPAEIVYETYPFAKHANIAGYKIARWSDGAEAQPVPWMDFFSRRPQEVLAERTWGGPRSATAPLFYQRMDAVGDAPASVLTAVPSAGYRVIKVDSEEIVEENGAAANVIDADPRTLWHTNYSGGAAPTPHEIDIDLGALVPLAGFRYLPRQDGGANGRVGEYRLQTSLDGRVWKQATRGGYADDQTSKQVEFPIRLARYVRFTALTEVRGTPYTSAAELSFLRAPLRWW